jgi:hypothetical protein
MMACSKCGAQRPDGRVFCGKCRNRMGNPCRTCGFDNLMDDQFCGKCGRFLNVSEPVQPPASDRAKEPSKPFLFYDQLLSDAQQDKDFLTQTTKTMEEDAIKKLFQENRD